MAAMIWDVLEDEKRRLETGKQQNNRRLYHTLVVSLILCLYKIHILEENLSQSIFKSNAVNILSDSAYKRLSLSFDLQD